MIVITSKRRRGCNPADKQASVIGNFTVNIFIRGERSRDFCRKTRQSRRLLGTIVLSRLVRSAGEKLGSRLKSRSESNTETSIGREKRSDVRRSGAGLLERKTYARFSCSCFLDGNHDAEHRLRNGTKRRLRAVKEVVASRRKCRAQGRRMFLKLRLWTPHSAVTFFFFPLDSTSVRMFLYRRYFLLCYL